MVRIFITYILLLFCSATIVTAIENAKGIEYKIISSVEIDYLSQDGASTQNMNEEENETNSNNYLKHSLKNSIPPIIGNLVYVKYSPQLSNSHFREVVIPPPDLV